MHIYGILIQKLLHMYFLVIKVGCFAKNGKQRAGMMGTYVRKTPPIIWFFYINFNMFTGTIMRSGDW